LHKNTLYITFDGLSDPLGRSQILPYLCGIAAEGFHVTILSCEKQDRLEKENEAIKRLIENLPITWHYIIYNRESGFLSRLNYIRKIRRLAAKISNEKKISLIHCRSYLASLIGLSFKLKRNIPFVFDMRGFWADERIDGGIWKKNNLLHRSFYTYFKRKEKQFIEHANAIVSLTKTAVNDLHKHYPDQGIESKTTIIPCCTDTDVFKREGTEPARLVSVSENDHVLIYTGSIGTWYYTREMINCVLTWKERVPTVKLVILTKDINELEQILKEYPPEQRSLIITASATYREVPKYLALAKAAIFFIKPSYSKIASSPTKMAECWAMDLPIITNPGIGDNDHYLKELHGGVLVNDFTHEEYMKACSAYLFQVDQGIDYRALALAHFDNKTAISRYVSIYRSLTS
jgi:glycosyltransferase involved in cell wall biosynthesis